MLIDRFVARALESPNVPALEYAGVTLDYSTLLGRASAVARHLDSLHVKPGDRVALALPKSHEAVVGILGVLMAGAAYVPLDVRQPPERLCRSLLDSDPKVMITSAALLDRLLDIEPTLLDDIHVVVAGDRSQVAEASTHDFSSSSDAFHASKAIPRTSPAYILYTSGSTGEPKGVVHSLESAAHFIDWAVSAFELGPAQVLANFAQLSFDLSILDVFGALTTGACVHLVQPEMLLRPKELVGKLEAWGTTLLYAVPSAIALLETDGDLAQRQLSKLKRVLYAGEPFAVPQLARVMQALPGARFFNLYGPTETNVCTFHALPSTIERSAEQIPIGMPCAHLNVEVLDERGHAQMPLAEGEICVSGPSVMTEYFRRAEATREAFFQSENFGDNRARYRTGDRGYCDEQGLFWFLGRSDRLVKKRGYRIELGEIESALDRDPAVREATVFSVQHAAGVQIHAAVSLHNGHAASVLTLKSQCGRLLPPYMVPDTILILKELPRTANGKVDLLRLRDMATV